MNYLTQEKIDMVFIYGKADQCLRKAVQTYKDKFPNRNCPLRYMYVKMISNSRKTGSVVKKHIKTREVLGIKEIK